MVFCNQTDMKQTFAVQKRKKFYAQVGAKVNLILADVNMQNKVLKYNNKVKLTWQL